MLIHRFFRFGMTSSIKPRTTSDGASAPAGKCLAKSLRMSVCHASLHLKPLEIVPAGPQSRDPRWCGFSRIMWFADCAASTRFTYLSPASAKIELNESPQNASFQIPQGRTPRTYWPRRPKSSTPSSTTRPSPIRLYRGQEIYQRQRLPSSIWPFTAPDTL